MTVPAGPNHCQETRHPGIPCVNDGKPGAACAPLRCYCGSCPSYVPLPPLPAAAAAARARASAARNPAGGRTGAGADPPPAGPGDGR